MARLMKDSGIEWIGQIPESWELRRLKYILTERNEKNSPVKTNEILSLTASQGVIPYAEKEGGGNKPKEDLSAYKLAYPEDIVMNSMNVLSGSVALSKYYGCVSPVYYMLYSDDEEIDIRFYNFLFKTRAFQRSLMGLGNGILIKESENGTLNTIRMRIPMEKLNKLLFVVPSICEQRKIVKYLDAKVSEIDLIISKTKETIETYKSYKNAIISEIVTKGLNDNVATKESGIKWVGEIPEHWNIHTLSQVFTQLKNKNTDLAETNLLSLSYGKIKRKDINSSDGLLPESFDGYNVIDKNDIVLRLTDLQNDHKSLRVGHAKERGIITSAYVTLRCKENIATDYYYYFLHTFDIFKGFYGMGAGVRQGLNYEGIRSMKILSPDIKEQQEIVEYLNVKCAEIDALIAKKEAFVEEMEAYKKSLIYEYVTGKKEVL